MGCRAVREVKEETGYDIVIEDNLFIKETETKGYKVKTYYFKVKKAGESEGINDPDNIIVEAGWKSLRDIQKLQHAYPEDLKVLESFLK